MSDATKTKKRWWKRAEPVFWILLVGFVVTMQWPALKGWYYRSAGTADPASTIAWRTNLDQALAEARVDRKPVLVDFSASWCPPCIAMKHEVWPNGKVAQAMKDGVVPVAIDVDKDGATAQRYEVDGIPSIVLLDGDGKILRRHDGYLPVDGVLRFIANK